MSPELAFVVFVALLWGPTALWLVFRTLRGHRPRSAVEPTIVIPEVVRRSELAPDELEAILEADGFWACGTCHSLNRWGANRCYACRMAKRSPVRRAPSELPLGPGVPVMAVGAKGRQPPPALPFGAGIPVMAVGAEGREAPGSLQFGPRVPVTAVGAARSVGEAAATPTAAAAATPAPPAPQTPVRALEHRVAGARREAAADVPVCPFLGLGNDPSTRYDFPDHSNTCHAGSARRATSRVLPGRLVTAIAGPRRPQPIGAEHQKTCCLTAAYVQCARYTAVVPVAAEP